MADHRDGSRIDPGKLVQGIDDAVVTPSPSRQRARLRYGMGQRQADRRSTRVGSDLNPVELCKRIATGQHQRQRGLVCVMSAAVTTDNHRNRSIAGWHDQTHVKPMAIDGFDATAQQPRASMSPQHSLVHADQTNRCRNIGKSTLCQGQQQAIHFLAPRGPVRSR